MFNLNKFIYAPSLKWKRGEYLAASSLPSVVKGRTLPIWRMPPPGSFDPEERRILKPAEMINAFGSRMADHWPSRLSLVEADGFINSGDVSIIGGDHPMIELLERVRVFGRGTRCGPVMAASAEQKDINRIGSWVANNTAAPAALRIRAFDLGEPGLKDRLSEAVAKFGRERKALSLLIDGGDLELSDFEGLSALLIDRLNEVPGLFEWGMIILRLSGFPSKTKIAPGQIEAFPRADYLLFEKLVVARENRELARLPVFGDYGAEPATFLPKVPVRPTARIRYTTPKNFVISQGENTKNGGYENIRSVAKRLVGSEHFVGREYSAGDARIAELANREGGPGTAATWKEASFSHHLRLTDRQLCTLFGVPPASSEPIAPVEQLAFI